MEEEGRSTLNQEFQSRIFNTQPSAVSTITTVSLANGQRQDHLDNDAATEAIHKGRISFFSGNPAIEEIIGIIHLYKDNNLPEIVHNVDNSNNNNSHLNVSRLPVSRGTLLCVLSVPTYMSPSDFASFTGNYHKSITNMRIVRSSSESNYMVILKFTTQESADSFYLDYNGKQFNSMEPETCMTLFVRSVEFVQQSENAILFPPSGQTEVPSCPVCLERLDENTSGILTILCNHSFHCGCLSKWKGDNCCPVCRYCQQPEGESPKCSVCRTTESLWICLICGNVGCGRYLNEHARQHYKDTMHAYALELQTSRVWDYAGDVYVHRLIQNKSDGKLVPVQSTSSEAEPETAFPGSKIESLSLEYSYLMEAQRQYFEEQLRRIQRERNSKLSQMEDEYAQVFEMKEQFERRYKEMHDEKKKWEKKVANMEKKMKEYEKETNFLRDINAALKQNQIEWKERVEETEKKLKDDTKDKKIQELQEQIQDLMFYLEAQQKISNDSELKDGQIVVVPSPNNNNKTSVRKKGPKR